MKLYIYNYLLNECRLKFRLGFFVHDKFNKHSLKLKICITSNFTYLKIDNVSLLAFQLPTTTLGYSLMILTLFTDTRVHVIISLRKMI